MTLGLFILNYNFYFCSFVRYYFLFTYLVISTFALSVFLKQHLAPSVKAEKKVGSILEGLSDSSNSAYWKTDEDVGAGMAGLAGDADTHPYVSFTINLL
ncbi:V-type proton ATPase subunit C [Trifolium repens]|nr:V-type proton ATPase subunit C [Trifolium repens]